MRSTSSSSRPFAPVLIIVAISAFMIVMDNTVVNIVKGAIKQDLHATDTTLEWIMTGYILIFSCLMIPGGRLVDRYGQRLMFSVGMAVFTLSSLAAAFSSTIAMLICARLVQGAGAAIALPATLVAINVGRTDRQRSLGMIVWVAVAAAANAFGPTIGAVISSTWSWQGVFLINVIPGALAVPLALLLLDGTGENPPTSLDLPGLLTSATMLFALSYALAKVPDLGLSSPAVLGVFALALIALFSLILVERWAPDPIFDLAFFRNKVFAGAALLQILVGLGFNGILYYGAQFMKQVLGFSDSETGLVFLPPALLIGLLTPLAFWLAGRVGPRVTVSLGLFCMAFGMVLFSTLHEGDGYLSLMPGVACVAIGSALSLPLPMYALKAVPDERAGVAGGIINVGREMSGGIAIALLGAIIYGIESTARHSGSSEAEAFRHGTEVGLPIGAAILLVGVFVGMFTLPRRSAVLSERRTSGEIIEHVVRPLPRPEPIIVPVPGLSAPPPWPLRLRSDPPPPPSWPPVSYGPPDSYDPSIDPRDPLGIGDIELHRR